MTNAQRAREIRAALARLEAEVVEPMSILETLKAIDGLEALAIVLASFRTNGLVKNLESIESVQSSGGSRSEKRLESLIVLAKALEGMKAVALDTSRGMAAEADAKAEAELR